MPSGGALGGSGRQRWGAATATATATAARWKWSKGTTQTHQADDVLINNSFFLFLQACHELSLGPRRSDKDGF